MDVAEEGETEEVEQDDSAMMAMMGMSGFGTTKACCRSLCESPRINNSLS